MKNNLPNKSDDVCYHLLHLKSRWFRSKKVKILHSFFFFMVFAISSALAQSRVSGIVTDQRGEPLAGATVKDKNSSAGIGTDGSGKFTLNINAATTLVVNYIGYNSKEVNVKPGDNVKVQLITNTNDLNEVVVVAYGTQKKATVTGAISTIKSTDLVRTPAIAATSALVGKVPGINARAADARPGNGTAIQIRNLGNPLYVIEA